MARNGSKRSKVKQMGIYEVVVWGRSMRLIATGNCIGILHEFLDCTDLKRQPLYYPETDVKLIYDGNTRGYDE